MDYATSTQNRVNRPMEITRYKLYVQYWCLILKKKSLVLLGRGQFYHTSCKLRSELIHHISPKLEYGFHNLHHPIYLCLLWYFPEGRRSWRIDGSRTRLPTAKGVITTACVKCFPKTLQYFLWGKCESRTTPLQVGVPAWTYSSGQATLGSCSGNNSNRQKPWKKGRLLPKK